MSSTLDIPAVTDATFDAEVLRTSGFVAVEFSAEWCGPCHVMTPIVQEVARELAPSLRVVPMDADANVATTVRLGVRSLPTMLVFRDGELVTRIVGAFPKAALLDRLRSAGVT